MPSPASCGSARGVGAIGEALRAGDRADYRSAQGLRRQAEKGWRQPLSGGGDRGLPAGGESPGVHRPCRRRDRAFDRNHTAGRGSAALPSRAACPCSTRRCGMCCCSISAAGSTELILDPSSMTGRPPVLAAWSSIGHGVVSLAERYGGDRVGRAAYDAMVAEIEAEIGPFAETHDIRKGAGDNTVQLLGTSGTVTTIAGIHLALPPLRQAAGGWPPASVRRRAGRDRDGHRSGLCRPCGTTLYRTGVAGT